MPKYNKLIRDKIPEIIEKSGKSCKIRKLDQSIFIEELKKKLVEEVEEYLSANDDVHAIEELADVLELIHSLSKIHGKGFEDVEDERRRKFEKRGGFNDKVYLEEVFE